MSEISNNTLLIVAELMILMMLVQLLATLFLIKVSKKMYLKLVRSSRNDLDKLLVDANQTLSAVYEEEIKYYILHKQYFEEKADHYEQETKRLAGEIGQDYRKFKYFSDWASERQAKIDKCFGEIFDKLRN